MTQSVTQSLRSALLAASAAVLLLFVSCLPAMAQCTFKTIAPNPFTPPTVRAEGLTEQVADIVLNCTGGAPTPAGQAVPTANFTVSLNTQVTSRILNQFSGASDALLIIDEPGGPGNPSTPQLPCTNPDGCTILGTGTGVGTFNGTAGRPNIFQGRVTGNSVQWNGIPIDPPPINGTRVFRITNVRANATALGVGSQIIANTVISGNSAPPVFNFSQPVGVIQQGVNVSVFDQQTVPNCTAFNNILTINNPPPGDVKSTLRFSEVFPQSFKTQSFTTQGAIQPVPGQVYNTESGFSSPAFTGTPLAGAGQADHATRLKATFNNIPNGVRLFVTNTNLLATGQATAGSPTFAQLINSDTPNPGFTPPLGTSGTAEIPSTNGLATAFWEIIHSDPKTIENFDFGVYSVFTPPPSLNANVPGQTMTVTGGFSGPEIFDPSTNTFLPPGFSNVSNPNGPDAASTLFGIQNGNPPLTGDPFFETGIITDSFGVTTFAKCGGAAQNLTVTSGGLTLTDQLNLGGFFLRDYHDAEIIKNFFVTNNTVQTSTAVGGGNFGSPIAPGGFGTDGYSKQDFSYQVTPTAKTDQKWLSVTSNGGGTPTTFTVKIDPAGLSPGNYTGNISISALGQNSLTSTLTATIPVTLTIAPPGPVALAAGFVSATTYQGNFAVPGMPLVVFGSAFGSSTLTGLSLTPDNTTITNSIAGTRVLFDGTPAPMIYSANGQISTIVPFELAGKTSTQVVVEQNGVQAPAVSLPVLAATPGLFTANSAGTGPGAILNANSDGTTSFNSPSNPAPAGSVVVLYASGAGQTKPAGKTGHLAIDAVLPAPVLPVTAFIDGVQAEVQYAGSAPGLFEGVLQVNVRIPASVKPGNRVVVLKVGSTQTPPWATVAVSAAQ